MRNVLAQAPIAVSGEATAFLCVNRWLMTATSSTRLSVRRGEPVPSSIRVLSDCREEREEQVQWEKERRGRVKHACLPRSSHVVQARSGPELPVKPIASLSTV